MFGYIAVNKDEMKMKDFHTYQSYYCGLCQSLKKSYGVRGQLTLSYDMTFLEILLSSLYEPNTRCAQRRCVMHPAKEHTERINQYSSYVADMNLILSYYKCQDDWKDDGKKIRFAQAMLLQRDFEEIRQKYPKKTQYIKHNLNLLSKWEKDQVMDIDQMAGTFGKIMAAMFVYRKDEWSQNLYRIGYYLGKFIYLMDAYEDIEDDIEKGNYNPLVPRWEQEDFVSWSQGILTMMIAECCKEFERLPLIESVDILRNILYSGVWTRFEEVTKKRTKDQEKKDVRSL
ncbi:MAG: DUF5685 family protein [Anaerostipes sp.]|nr:DUF5685 family protein [Anaerostipes sp.]